MEKYSKQREEILDVLKKSYSHPTAEEIYEEIKKNNSTASRGTVYRNLLFLTKKEIIIKIPIKDGPDRYDFMKNEHHHAVCDSCGRVFDFQYKVDFEKLKQQIEKQTGIEILKNSIIITGICEECKKAISK